MLYILPPIISWTIGYLTLALLLRKTRPPVTVLLFLGASAGMGISAALVFSSLVVLGQLSAVYVIVLHLLLLVVLAASAWRVLPAGERLPLREFKLSDGIGLAVLGLFTVPVVAHALLYPQGGWDAWSCWNLKARFIFLGGADWKNMFDPLLWRSNLAYPLLVPALNVWSWCFGREPVWGVTLANSCLITFVTAGTLLFSLKRLTGRLHTLLAPAWLLSILFVVKLASSQYSDLMVGNYLLAALTAFIYFERTGGRGWLTVMALMLGALAFTKSEGTLLALLTAFAAVLCRALQTADRQTLPREALVFISSLALALLPTIIFQIFFAPNSHTFINGLTSTLKPASLERLRVVLYFWGIELLSGKWNGFWLLSLAGLILGRGKCLRPALRMIPLTLLLYCLAVAGVYWINTFFEIGWWLANTLNRILFALTPAVIFWVFLGLENSASADKIPAVKPRR